MGLPEVLNVGPMVSWASELRGLNYEKTPWKALVCFTGPMHIPPVRS